MDEQISSLKAAASPVVDKMDQQLQHLKAAASPVVGKVAEFTDSLRQHPVFEHPLFDHPVFEQHPQLKDPVILSAICGLLIAVLVFARGSAAGMQVAD